MCKPQALLWIGLVLTLACGCTQPTATAVTVVHRDGSFDRRIELSTNAIQYTSKYGHAPKLSQNDEVIRTLKENFDFRSSTGKIVRPPQKKHDELPYWVKRSHYVRGSDAVHDVVLKTSGKDVIANEASVRPIGDGRWVFTERYHWIGKPVTDKDWRDPGMLKEAKQVLGPDFTGAETTKLCDDISKSMIWVLAGPDYEPHAVDLLSKDSSKADAAFVELVQRELNREVHTQRERDAAHLLLERFMKEEKEREKQQKPDKNGPNQAGWMMGIPGTAINVRVRVPGKVLSTNAQLDKDGLWCWSMSSLAPQVKDVVLSVVYRP